MGSRDASLLGILPASDSGGHGWQEALQEMLKGLYRRIRVRTWSLHADSCCRPLDRQEHGLVWISLESAQWGADDELSGLNTSMKPLSACEGPDICREFRMLSASTGLRGMHCMLGMCGIYYMLGHSLHAIFLT